MKRRSNGRRLTCALPIIAGICSLALAIAPFCPAQTEQPTTTGKSASGNTRWEIRSPVDNRGVSTIWIWPNGQKDKATQLAETPNFNQIAFSADDAWVVMQSQLSSGSYFSFFRKQADGKYAEDAPAEQFFENGEMEKTATAEQVDRWSVNFEQWTHGFGPYAFIFSWSARLSRRGPDSYFIHYSGWRGVYDLQSRTVIKTLERGNMTTAGQDAEARLNDIYRELRSLLDEPGKESLRLEELVWLKKRDEIKNPQEKTDFTNARCDELGDRIQKLRK